MSHQPEPVAAHPPAGGGLGLSVASHSGLAPAGIGAVARAAERAGFAAVFVAEGHGDALSLCHPVAAATRQVRVGTAIANAALRPPVLAAKTATQLDHATGGRFILGLGVANPVMNTRFGVPPFAPLPMIEEYVGAVRAVLGGHPGYEGRVYRTGMVPLDSPPLRAELPVYLAALGPRMLELAGRVADGVILNLMTPAQAGEAAALVRTAAQAADRDPASVEVVCVVHCCLSDDLAAAAAAARAVVPRYVLHPAVPRLFGETGGQVDLRGVRERVLAGDRAGAAGEVPQQAADGFVAHGSAAQCAARVAEYRAAGVDLPVVAPMPIGPDWGYERTIGALGSAAPAGAAAAGAAEGAGPRGGRGRRPAAAAMKEGTAISEDLVIRFFAALEAGDIAALRGIYSPDAVIWHNDDLIEQPVEENLAT